MDTEVSQKIRLAIKAKLLELGMHVDEELPDYVMVLVANRRSKSQMEQDLNLFLGDNTNSFTSWLHDVLKKLEAVTATLPLPNRKASTESKLDQDKAKKGDKEKDKEKKKSSSKKKKESEEIEAKSATKRRTADEKDGESKKKKQHSLSTSTSAEDKPEEPGTNKNAEEPAAESGKNDKVAFSFKPQSKLGKSSIAEEEEVVAKRPPLKLSPQKVKRVKTTSESSSKLTEMSSTQVEQVEKSQSQEQIVSESPSAADGNMKNEEPEDFLNLNLEHDADEFIDEKEKTDEPEQSTTTKGDQIVSKDDEDHSLELLRKKALETTKKKQTKSSTKDQDKSPPPPPEKKGPSTSTTDIDIKETTSSPVKERPRLLSRIGHVNQIRSIILSNAARQRDQISDRHRDRDSRDSRDRNREKEKEKDTIFDRLGRRRRDEDYDTICRTSRRDDDIKRKSGRLVTMTKSSSSRVRSSISRSRSPSPFSPSKSSKYGLIRRTSRHSRSRSRSPYERSRSSREKRHREVSGSKLIRKRQIAPPLDPNDDEEYDPCRPAVSPLSSVVQVAVAERPKKRDSRQANKKLIMLAMEDAQKSIVRSEIHATEAKGKRISKTSSIDERKRKIITEEVEYDPAEIEVKNKKGSVKSRLGKRVERNENSITMAERVKKFPELYLGTEKYQHQNDDKLSMIRINVPSSVHQSRNVTLESYEQKSTATTSLTTAPKRFSIQVNVNSDDDTTSDESEGEEEVKETVDTKTTDNKSKEKLKKKSEAVQEKKMKENDNEDLDDVFEEIIEYEIASDDDIDEVEERIASDDDVDSQGSYKKNKVKTSKQPQVSAKNDDTNEYEMELKVSDYTLPDPADPDENFDRLSTTTKESNESPEKIKVIIAPKSTAGAKNLTSSLSNQNSPSTPTTFRVIMNNVQGDNEKVNSVRDQASNNGLNSITNHLPLYRTISNSSNTITNNNNSFKPSLPITIGRQKPFLPITGNHSAIPQSGICKFWPNCTFKEKCKSVHPKCKYGSSCTKSDRCPYKHDGFIAPAEEPAKLICKFFPKCHTMSCKFYHPSPCRFSVNCTDPKCTDYHPGKTIGQTKMEKSTYFNVGTRSNYTKPPAAHLLKWKAPAQNPGTTPANTTSESK